MAERTHDPTPKRLREARAKGDVPRAPLLASALGLLVAVALVPAVLVAVLRRMATTFRLLAPIDHVDAWSLGTDVILVVAPISAALIAIAALSAVAQGSLTFSPARLSPDPSRLDPFGGVKNIFDPSRRWGALRGTIVTAALVWVLGAIVVDAIRAGKYAVLDVEQTLALSARFATRIAVTAAAVAIAFALADVVVGRRLWLSRLRMTRDEVIREHKEGEADPELKRRREDLHRELLSGEAIRAVREATVIVVSPSHLACALRYGARDDDEAPTLLAKGEGALAARMLEAARLYGVPVVHDAPVARALHEMDVGTEIPEALYEAVAEVLRIAWGERE